MEINAKGSSESKLRAPTLDLFGPPPILEGETEEDYGELHDRVFRALDPADFIEELWVRDIVDVRWNISRLRRMSSALLAARVRILVDHEAASLVETNPELMDGSKEQKQDMERLLDAGANCNFEARKAKYPRAAERYMKLWEAARSRLNLNELQATAMIDEIDSIERIEALIIIAERRVDAVIRELDRHRTIQKLHHDIENSRAKLKTVEPRLIDENKPVA
jgi:hypothetical protein